MEGKEAATARQGGSWAEVARARRERLAAAIPAEWVLSADLLARLDTCTDVRHAPAEAGFLSPRELALTDIDDAARLCRMLAERKCSAVELVTAFCKRAAIAHQLLNCCLDLFFDEALKRARELDDELERTGRPVGALHGLPISLKDQFNVVGHDTTLGYVGRDSQPADHNSTLVEGLLAQGAVLYVKTSLPQTIMKPETVNHLIGRTTHPADRRLSPGGSSGGEGALLAFHGSPLGVGTDIGGSIRIPSALCGLYGLRPTHGRVPYFRAENTMDGQESVHSVCGPMGRSLESVELFMRANSLAQPWLHDPKVVPLPWDDAKVAATAKAEQLVFGVIWTDGEVTPHPPITRALRETVAKLRAAGHEVIDWDGSSHREAFELGCKFWAMDGGKDFEENVRASGEPRIDGVYVGGPEDELSVYQLMQLNRRRYEWAGCYLERWNASAQRTACHRPIDVILSPVLDRVGAPHESLHHVGYTVPWNLLDFPALTVPIATVEPHGRDAAAPLDYIAAEGRAPHGETDVANQALWQARGGVEGFGGLPVVVQVVGRRFEEERVVGAVRAIQRVLVAE